jgi:hypothetical protein
MGAAATFDTRDGRWGFHTINRTNPQSSVEGGSTGGGEAGEVLRSSQ